MDTCIFSNLIQQKIKSEDLKALEKISGYNNVEFVTSPVTLEEFNDTSQNSIRTALKVFYKIINKISNVNFINFKGGFSLPFRFPTKFGKAEEDELYKKIKKIFKKKDINHIFNAIKDNCDFFLTLDYKSILKKTENNRGFIQKTCPNLKFADPKTLLKIIQKIN